MRVLVTSRSGYIGSHVVRQLVAAGHEIVVLDNLSVDRPEDLAQDHLAAFDYIGNGGASIILPTAMPMVSA